MVAVETMTRPRIDLGRTVEYIENCQTGDGGYFFARIPPSPAGDTYYAVKSLQILGRQPANRDSVIDWLRESATGGLLGNPKGVFFLVEASLALGLPPAELQRWASRLHDFANPEGGFGAWRNVDVEVASELDITYRAVTTLLDLGLEMERDGVLRFLFRFLNRDGGFGTNDHSTLASTYYAVQVLARLGVEKDELDATVRWLGRREAIWDLLYLEQVHRLVMSLIALNEVPRERQRAIDLVLDCRRENGGFARARFGIPTLEYTHYALEALSALEVM